MAVDNIFLKGNYQGVDFSFTDNSQQGGRKTAVFDYPQTDTRTVQDLGLYLPVYDITIQVTGDETNYLKNKSDILKALDTPARDYLNDGNQDTNFIHPIDGALAVYSGKYTVSESDSYVGLCTIKVKLYAISKETYPIVSAGDGSINVKNILDDILDQIRKAFEDIFNLIIDLQNVLSKLLDYLAQINSIINNILNLVDIAKNALSPFISELQNLKNNTSKLLRSPRDLANSINNTYDAMVRLSSSNSGKTIINQSIFGTSVGNEEDVTTLSIQNSEKNRKVLNAHMNSTSLVYELGNTVNTNYNTDEDINNQIIAITKQLDYVNNNNSYEDELGIQQSIYNQDVLDSMTSAYDNTIKYLVSQRANTKNISNIYVNNDSLLPLIYSYYGDVDLYDDLNILNDVGNPHQINGNFKTLV